LSRRPGSKSTNPQAASATALDKNSILLAVTAKGQVVYGGEEIGVGGVRPWSNAGFPNNTDAGDHPGGSSATGRDRAAGDRRIQTGRRQERQPGHGFVLSESGRVEDLRIESSSRPEFEPPALEAVRRWRFKPGEKNGEPVRTYMRLPIRFRT
jgi:TonB family protein